MNKSTLYILPKNRMCIVLNYNYYAKNFFGNISGLSDPQKQGVTGLSAAAL